MLEKQKLKFASTPQWIIHFSFNIGSKINVEVGIYLYTIHFRSSSSAIEFEKVQKMRFGKNIIEYSQNNGNFD